MKVEMVVNEIRTTSGARQVDLNAERPSFFGGAGSTYGYNKATVFTDPDSYKFKVGQRVIVTVEVAD